MCLSNVSSSFDVVHSESSVDIMHYPFFRAILKAGCMSVHLLGLYINIRDINPGFLVYKKKDREKLFRRIA